MSFRIDLVVGGVRAAELVNEYRGRLQEWDLLPDEAALAVACTAYADGYVHVVAAVGQIWESVGEGEGAPPHQIRIVEIGITPGGDHFAEVRMLCGISACVSLDDLGLRYRLVRWPQGALSGPAE
ncbi:hypothetical protein ACIQMR_38210 [Streptomyces sp. NPDC091376]|uniref:hypothetical protein n=1 Tax=Streptomyces sp. NPDC091376 TaxID=3365994 RepID=UPI003818D6F1